MKKYSTVCDKSETDISSVTTSRRGGDGDSMSVASISSSMSAAAHQRRFVGHKRINSELSEPLSSSVVDVESLGGGGVSADPYFVFRSDLQKKLESLDEYLADYLRTVHETVRSIDE
jgi:hypothetical protein